ncbi:uncharacterized protein LOC110466147 [Mizuhopecten yessoensis]|uniref:Protein mab-21-like 2 n=1 Tax=Mizuhopecten yessoensis TaxID=6573 RepID=A0A210PQ03_MIZYE|nr:uncharacterized protein LOC110466147 [Mizuhopecten yessoensis]OWF38558.1 Protein mab-21-like 2 [Mizuhopecten yessoensis]
MEPDNQVLGVYADALTTVIKKHDLTTMTMELIRTRFQLFTDLLNAQVEGIEVIQVGSSYDDLHLTRVLDHNGSHVFFPELDFDFDMIYLNYIVAESNSSSNDQYDAEKISSVQEPDDANGKQQTGSPIGVPAKEPKAPFAIIESTPNPGYVKLRVTPHGRQMVKKPGCVIGNFITSGGYLLNTAFTSEFVAENVNTEIIYSRTDQLVTETLKETGIDSQGYTPIYTKSGPAITEIDKAGEGVTYDFVHAFPCLTWPTVAKGWADRARKCHWPGETLIQKIPQDGCLLVAMGSHQSSDPTEEWRVSFVRAERVLSHSLSDLQKTCYSVVKVMLKSILSDRAVLTSYHMKNTFYYLCEEVASASGSWTLDSLGDKIMQFLKYIAVSLHIHRIPHYFLPPLNLIGHYSKDDVEATKKEVEGLIRKPFTALMEACEKLECFSVIKLSQKFGHLQGELKPMLVIYMFSVETLWNLGCINIGEDLAKMCFQKVVKLNAVTSGYVKKSSRPNTFTALSVPALLKPLAHAYSQQGDCDKALWLFLAIEESDPELVAASYTNVLSNIACLYGNKSTECDETTKHAMSEYKAKAVQYFEKALSLIYNSPSLHLMYGNFLMDCKKPTLTAVKQFEKAVAIETPCDDDDALIQLTIPGARDQPSHPCYVPGQVAAYYLQVQCWVEMLDTFQARRVCKQFEEFIREKCILKHKVVACQLCAISYKLAGLSVKSALVSAEMVKHGRVG